MEGKRVSMDYDYLELKEAGSKGNGVFTKRKFRKDDLILKVNIVEVFNENASHRSQIAVDKWVSYHPHFIHFMNHSCEFNCSTTIDDKGSQFVIAMRDIQIGEELTLNYAFRNLRISNDSLPCTCGSKDCTGVVASWSASSEKMRKHYLKKYSKFILPYISEFELNQREMP
jgi:hypothetical protein